MILGVTSFLGILRPSHELTNFCATFLKVILRGSADSL